MNPSQTLNILTVLALAFVLGLEKLIAVALAGQPPLDVAEELKDLFIQINLHRYLERKGVQLADDQLQLLTC